MTHTLFLHLRSTLALAIAATLAACGGGGSDTGGGAVTPYTATCADGTTRTSTTSVGAAQALCPSVSSAPRWAAASAVAAAPTAPTAVLPAAPIATVTTNDPLFANQNQLTPSALGNDTANIAAAWTLSTGAAHNIVVAVIDSGIDATHPDLVGKILPGYNFRADPVRNTDTTPRGPATCSNGSSPSMTHGTAVAGVIAANSNNGIGIVGIHWGAKILPLRVNDGCLAAMGDISDAIRWAAGLTVVGAPNNTTPAKVINISQSASGACLPSLQTAIDDALAAGAIIMASAGNSSGAVWMPANCAGVIALTQPPGVTTAYGAEVSLASKPLIYTTYPNGNYGQFGGTSSVTPYASGVAALVLSVAPNLTAAGMRRVLMESARPFPLVNPYTGIVYTPALTGTYGAGYLDAWRAMNYVQSMLLAQITTAAVASNTSAMTLTSASTVSGPGASITSRTWSQLSGPVATLTGAGTNTATVVFAAGAAGAGTYVFQLVVTDSLGRSSTSTQKVVVGV